MSPEFAENIFQPYKRKRISTGYKMPVMDGYEATRIIRSLPYIRLSGIPII